MCFCFAQMFISNFISNCIWRRMSWQLKETKLFESGHLVEVHCSCNILHVIGWDKNRNKNPKYTSNTFFTKMVSVILGSSYHIEVCPIVFLKPKQLNPHLVADSEVRDMRDTSFHKLSALKGPYCVEVSVSSVTSLTNCKYHSKQGAKQSF